MHPAPSTVAPLTHRRPPYAAVDAFLRPLVDATSPAAGLRALVSRLQEALEANAVVAFRHTIDGPVELAREGGLSCPGIARHAARQLGEAGSIPTDADSGPQGMIGEAAGALAVPVFRAGERIGALVAVGPGLPPEALTVLETAALGAALGWPPESLAPEESERDRRLTALGDLAGGIAHDFNNALTSVLGSVSLARLHGGLSDSLDDLLSEAEQACLRARRLTRQLLTFAGGGEPIRRATDLGALLRDVVDEAAADRKHRYSLRVDEGMAAAYADEDQIRQAAVFLIDNARAVMPDGGEIRIRVHGRPAEGQLELSVEDRGPGIPADELERIFDPYASGRTGIRGLGLSAVHSIARRHGGSVVAQSTPGQGSVFRVRIPVAETIEVEPPQAVVRQTPATVNVLVMDDDATVRASLERMLQHLGHRVVSVEDGAAVVDAWVAARDRGDAFDLCVMDLTVPHGVGGREAIQRLKAVDPEARAIVASGYSKDPIMAQFREHGFVGVLEKPCEMAGLARAVAAAMASAPIGT